MSQTNSSPAAGAKVEPVVVERTYRARAEELWDLWTTKEGFESWWGPESLRVEVHVLEPRTDGRLEYDMIADTPDAIAAMQREGFSASHATHGWFAEFSPYQRLSLMHVIDFIPGLEPYESRIDVEFEPGGSETRMIVKLHPHREPHWTEMSVAGFRSQLTKLDRRFGWEDARATKQGR